MSEANQDVPEGFEVSWATTHLQPTGCVAPGSRGLFFSRDALPALPLKTYGELWHEGWDIPTVYAIDADNRCWKDYAHGGPLVLVCMDALLRAARENYSTLTQIRKALGLKPTMPDWMEEALRNGWHPPQDWDRSVYA